MSAAATAGEAQRLLTFQVSRSLYALPIACVIEVSEPGPLACIPTVDSRVAGVMNHHGDALPLLRRSALLDVEETELPEAAHVLVITARPTGGARIGLPVDRIVGLVDGAGATAHGSDPVAERRPVDGRVVFVLDPRRLVARAGEAIEGALQRSA